MGTNLEAVESKNTLAWLRYALGNFDYLIHTRPDVAPTNLSIRLAGMMLALSPGTYLLLKGSISVRG